VPHTDTHPYYCAFPTFEGGKYSHLLSLSFFLFTYLLLLFLSPFLLLLSFSLYIPLLSSLPCCLRCQGEIPPSLVTALTEHYTAHRTLSLKSSFLFFASYILPYDIARQPNLALLSLLFLFLFFPPYILFAFLSVFHF
jgi:hypothetical protein